MVMKDPGYFLLTFSIKNQILDKSTDLQLQWQGFWMLELNSSGNDMDSRYF